MNTRYDVAIIGCGEAGILAGYELMRRHPALKVVTLDQGADMYTRSCPIVAGKVRGASAEGVRYHVRFWRGGRLLRRQV